MSQSELKIDFISSDDVPSDVWNFFNSSNDGKALKKNGEIYIKTGKYIAHLKDDPFADMLIQAFQNQKGEEGYTTGPVDLWTELVHHSSDEAVKKLKAYGIRSQDGWCAVVFQRIYELSEDNHARFFEFAPIEEMDQIVFLANGDIVLVMRMKGRSEEDICDFTSAMIDTLENEAGQRWISGIGEPVTELRDLHQSYIQAKKALETGKRFNDSKSVYIYSKQMLERFLEAIPNNVLSDMKLSFFTNKAKKILTEEMMQTIKTFFQNDLNISTTSKQLYVHRNTLMYRLDKIKKETGLDLRIFHDAVIFQIFLSLPE